MLVEAGFGQIAIQVKENAAEIIKDWIPGSGAEECITSAYVTAVKPVGSAGSHSDVHVSTHGAKLNPAGVADCGAAGSRAAAIAGC